jgi:hypothetical protein
LGEIVPHHKAFSGAGEMLDLGEDLTAVAAFRPEGGNARAAPQNAENRRCDHSTHFVPRSGRAELDCFV